MLDILGRVLSRKCGSESKGSFNAFSFRDSVGKMRPPSRADWTCVLQPGEGRTGTGPSAGASGSWAGAGGTNTGGSDSDKGLYFWGPLPSVKHFLSGVHLSQVLKPMLPACRCDTRLVLAPSQAFVVGHAETQVGAGPQHWKPKPRTHFQHPTPPHPIPGPS